MVNKAQSLYKQYRSNTLQSQNHLNTENFETLFQDHIPVRDDEVPPTPKKKAKKISQKYFQQKKNEKIKKMLEESTHQKISQQKYKCVNSEKIYLTYCPEDPSPDLNNAVEVLKKRYFGAFEAQETKISKQFAEIFEITGKVDHLVNNFGCKNARINMKLGPVIQNMFVVYQREIIELLIDDL
jgi:hypothetical protein